MRQKKHPSRQLRLSDQIQRDIAEAFRREFDVTRDGLVTVKAVDLSQDNGHVKVYFSVMGGDGEKLQERLNRRARHFQAILFKKLSLHAAPQVHFFHDTQTESGIALTHLIEAAVAQATHDDGVSDTEADAGTTPVSDPAADLPSAPARH